jgi:carbon starvation protein
MTVLVILLVGGGALVLGGRIYAPVIARVLGERADRVTPAVTVNDGRDYVPTRTPIVFAHHYASIAGAGPIVGPVLAILYGWGPALLWIIVGGIFLGAVHDYVATHIALREGGKNLTVIARRYIGRGAFVMLLVLLVFLLALVCAAFLDLSATALTSRVSLEALGLPGDQTLFRIEGGQAVVGGIASTSVIVITCCSPLIGFLYLKLKARVLLCSFLALIISGGSIVIGLHFPLSVSPNTWKLMISGYVLVSAGLPVWLFLQSRDFINVHILYVGIAFLVAAVLAAAVRGGGQVAGGSPIPFDNMAEASSHPKLGPGWPVLFVVIACGAVSGFHGLCAGGTTCKQLDREPAARRVGYYGMLLESFLAVCVVCCLMIGLTLADYRAYCYPADAKGNALLTFAVAVGHTAHVGFGLPTAAGVVGAMLLLEGFLVTTLDTAIRLTRYMIEEGWATFFARFDVFADASSDAGRAGARNASTPASRVVVAGTGGLTTQAPSVVELSPILPAVPTRGLFHAFLKLLRHYWVNSGLAVALMLLLVYGTDYMALWKIFGSTNQLLAAMTLLIGSCWLFSHGRPVWYTLLPALFMLVTSVWMLVRVILANLREWPDKAALVIVAHIILAMACGIVAATLVRWHRMCRARRALPAV